MDTKTHFQAPDNIAFADIRLPSIFLAGSIEMGVAEEWQTKATQLLDEGGKFNIFNPRRKDWDGSWVPKYGNPQFDQQVLWELNALERSDLILMYFDPNTKSPISLLEFGLYATSSKLHVVCSEDFYRSGNIEIVCSMYNIPLYNSLSEAIQRIIQITNG